LPFTSEHGTKFGGVASIGTFAVVHPALGYPLEALPTSAAGPVLRVGTSVGVHPAVGVPLALERPSSMRCCVQVSPDTSGSQYMNEQGTKLYENGMSEESMRCCVQVSPDTSGSHFFVEGRGPDAEKQCVGVGGVASVGTFAVVHPALGLLFRGLAHLCCGP
jgi:hypothetical protein